MTIHTDNPANGKLIRQKPEYRCSSCGDFFPGDELEEVPYRDPQNGERLNFYFCHKSECQDRNRRQLPLGGPMNREGQSEPRRGEAPRTSFWAGILLLVLIGMTIFVVFKVGSSLIGV